MTRPSKPTFLEKTLQVQQTGLEFLSAVGLPGIGEVSFAQELFLPPVTETGAPMGFFSKLLKGAVRIGKGLLGLGAPAARAAAPVARRAAVPAVLGAGAVAAGALTGAALTPEQQQAAIQSGQFVINPATGALVPIGGGNGRFTSLTTVSTIDRVTGQTIRQNVFQGRPFIMSKEIAHMKAVFRKIQRAHGKIPSKTRAPSLNKMISDAIKDRMLHEAQRGAAGALSPA